MKNFIRQVMSVKQSPLNEGRWLSTLICGHEVWTSAKRRPTAKTRPCAACREEAKFNPFYKEDVRYPCPRCKVDSGEPCKRTNGLEDTPPTYVHLGRRLRRLREERT